MGFFDRAIVGFDRGVQLGARTEERRQYREQREKERTEDIGRSERWREEDINRQEQQRRENLLTQEADKEAAQKQRDIENTRAGLKLSTELAEKQKKEQYEKIEKQFNAIRQLHEGGASDEDVLPLVQKLYTENWPDGVAAQFHTKKTAPPELLKTWSQDPENSKGEILMLVSRAADGKGRAVGFSSTDKLLKFLAGGLSQNKYLEETKKVEQSVAAANAAAKPYYVKDGQNMKLVVDVYESTPGGAVRKKDLPVAYEGPAPVSEIEKKVADIKAIPDAVLSPDEKKVVLGLREKDKQEKPKTPIETEKAKAETKKIEAETKKIEAETGEVRAKTGRVKLGGKVTRAESAAQVKAWYASKKDEWTDELGEPLPDYKDLMKNIELYEKQDLDAVRRGYPPKNSQNIVKSLSEWAARGKTAKKETTTTTPTIAAPKAKELEAEMKKRGFVKGADGRWAKPAAKVAQSTNKKTSGITRGF